MVQVTIETIKNGPYIVTGEVDLIDAALLCAGVLRIGAWNAQPVASSEDQGHVADPIPIRDSAKATLSDRPRGHAAALPRELGSSAWLLIPRRS